jgi:hypothetical protein
VAFSVFLAGCCYARFLGEQRAVLLVRDLYRIIFKRFARSIAGKVTPHRTEALDRVSFLPLAGIFGVFFLFLCIRI